jgi:hypothetical protein
MTETLVDRIYEAAFTPEVGRTFWTNSPKSPTREAAM